MVTDVRGRCDEQASCWSRRSHSLRGDELEEFGVGLRFNLERKAAFMLQRPKRQCRPWLRIDRSWRMAGILDTRREPAPFWFDQAKRAAREWGQKDARGVAMVHGKLVGGQTWIQNVPVCTFKTSPCVPAPRAHVSTHVRVVPAYTGTF